MAGQSCPGCGKQTFFRTPTGRACTKCGMTMTVPANGGKGGQGRICSNCGEARVFDGKCRTCGAIYKAGRSVKA